jgi:hypothetical protein
VCPTDIFEKSTSIITALRFIYKLAHYNYANDFEESVKHSFIHVENQIFCVLHLHKRIIEKVMTLLFTRSLEELISDVKIKRVQNIEMHSSYINTLALGDENQPGYWKCPVKNGDEVGDASFTDGQAKKVEEKRDGILKIFDFGGVQCIRLEQCL